MAPLREARPRVSVVIAARDAAPTLAATLDSLSRQSLNPCEIVVVDDGSTDDTAAQAERAGATVLRTPPVGLAAARNLALPKVSGDVVAIVDADDVFTPDHVAAGVEALRNGADAVAVDAWYWVQGRVSPFTHFSCSQPPPVLTQDVLLEGNPLLSTCFVRTDVLRAVGGYDARLSALEDYDFWLRLVEAGYRVVPAGAPTMWYRREGGMTADATWMYEALQTVLDARRERVGVEGESAEPVARHAAVGAGNWALLAGDATVARQHWARARALGDRRATLRVLSAATSVAPGATSRLLRRRLTAAGRPLPAQVVTWWRREGRRQPVVVRPDLAGAG